MTLQRYLDDIELQFARNSGRKPGYTFGIEYQGHMDEVALARAFRVLCARDPVLSARIRPDDRGQLLYVPPNHHPELQILDGDENTLQHEELKLRDPAEAVATLLLIRGETRGYLALIADHAIVDGHRLVAVFGKLCQLYTEIVNGADIAAHSVAPLPSPPSHLLQERWGLIQAASPSKPTDGSGFGKISDILERRIHLSEEDTSRLVAAAHDHTTSVHALVCGAILVAHRDQGKATEPTPMACWSAVDLRNRLTPPIGATETTNLIGLNKAVVTVPANGNPVAVGREVKAQLDDAIARREIFTDIGMALMAASARIRGPLEPHLAQPLVTNVGVIPPYIQPAGLVITDILLPSRKQTRGEGAGYGVFTYDGRLNIRCGYPSATFSREEIEEIVKQATAQLCHIGTS